MLAHDVLKTIRQHRGPIYVGVGMVLRSDVAYVRAVKSDLLVALTHLADGEAATRLVGRDLYVENAD